VSFAGSKGYAFTVDEAKEFAKATAKAAGRELTDAELDGVTGGVGSENPWLAQPSFSIALATAMMEVSRNMSSARSADAAEQRRLQQDIFNAGLESASAAKLVRP
jgi:hypothetical protein